ncbi:MAG: hypothetical protein ACRD8U_24160 [Pyrinomonadaceae bacterium]
MKLPIPDSIRRIADSEDRKLAWYFFVFFSRFEYALKRHSQYLMPGTGDAQPNWDRFASDHATKFDPTSTPALGIAIKYFKTSPPRKQLRNNGEMSWSEPIQHDGREPLLVWLLRVVRIVRNNLFHGGKFLMLPVSDPSRDRNLITNAVVILDACLKLDPSVNSKFNEGIDE